MNKHEHPPTPTIDTILDDFLKFNNGIGVVSQVPYARANAKEQLALLITKAEQQGRFNELKEQAYDWELNDTGAIVMRKDTVKKRLAELKATTHTTGDKQ